MDEDLSSSCLSHALADIEILQSAYPDETSPPTENLSTAFPLHLTLHLTEDAHIELAFVEGYPHRTNVQVAKYRSSRQNHANIELAVTAVRKTAAECLEAGAEGGLACCAAAFQAWHAAEEAAATAEIANAEASNEVTSEGAAISKKFHWVSGIPLLDRKSTFQAHVCRVTCELAVRLALDELIGSSNKIQKASHNMYAYRFTKPNPSGSNPIIQHDNDDDGEDAAGSRLAHLLEMRKEDGVLVVVSRWFGGIHLGPKRFAHITNVARELLQTCRENPGMLVDASV